MKKLLLPMFILLILNIFYTAFPAQELLKEGKINYAEKDKEAYDSYLARHKTMLGHVKEHLPISGIEGIVKEYLVVPQKEWEENSKQLMKAVQDNNVEEVEKLLKSGNLNINYQDVDNMGLTPLGLVAGYKGNLEIAKLLLDAGADTKIVSAYNHTPLTLASLFGKLEIVKLLLEKNPTIADKSLALFSTLYLGYSPQLIETAKLLLDAGANPNAIIDGKDVNTFLMQLASSNRNKNFVEIAKLLLKYGADLNKEISDLLQKAEEQTSSKSKIDK